MNNKFKEKFEKKLLEILKKYDNKKYGIIIKSLESEFFFKSWKYGSISSSKSN